jgi:uncharacterized protein (TIGR00251 family)
LTRHTVRVKPGASREKIEVLEGGEIALWTRAKAMDGKANEAVVRALAEHWGVSKSRVAIRSGLKSKIKVIELSDPERAIS